MFCLFDVFSSVLLFWCCVVLLCVRACVCVGSVWFGVMCCVCYCVVLLCCGVLCWRVLCVVFVGFVCCLMGFVFVWCFVALCLLRLFRCV